MVKLPESPELKLTVCPRALAIFIRLSCEVRVGTSKKDSGSPQLLEIATTPGVADAVATAANRSLSKFVGAMTSRIFAPGAIAWTHSTSSVVSVAQPALASVEKFDSVGVPTMVRLTGGRPMAA